MDPAPPDHSTIPPRSPRARAAVRRLVWVYGALIVAAWVFLRIEGDRSWLGVLAIFSPRQLLLTPLAFLVPLAALFNRRSLGVLAVATIIIIFPIMQLCIPWRGLWDSRKPSLLNVRVLTLNLHNHAADMNRLAALIDQTDPDLVLLQEWNPPYPRSPLSEDGRWYTRAVGPEFLASRFPIESGEELSQYSAAYYVLDTPAGKVNLINVHLFSPHLSILAALHGKAQSQDDLEQNILSRQSEAQDLRQFTGHLSGPLLIAGDFNLCPDSWIFRHNFGEFADAFETAGWGFGWTYRVKWTTVRIDHILANGDWSITHCRVGPDVGSPHHPLIGELSLTK